MALWPNNYSSASGWSPYRRVGISSLYKDTPVGGASLGIHTIFPKTASIPEGAAPKGAWVFPRTAGGMSASEPIATFDSSLNLLSGGAVVGTATLVLDGTSQLSLRVVLSGSFTEVLTVPDAAAASILALSGSGSIALTADNQNLSIIDPMTGSFVCALSGSADLRGRLSMEGAFNNIGEIAPDYGGVIHVADWGTDAFAYPAGTDTVPVATLECAKVLAERYNIHEYHLKGNFTFTSPYADTVFVGIGPKQFNKVNLNDQLLTNVKFVDCVIEGKLNTDTIGGSGWQSSIARVEFKSCYLQSVEDLQGITNDCQIDGPTKIKAGGWLSATGTVIEGDFTVFDMRSTSGTTVSMDMVSGWAQFQNAVTGCLIELNVKGGEVGFDNTCTGGEYYLEGIGTLFNESAMVKKDNHFVWDEPLAYHTDPESTGAILSDMDVEVDELHKLQGLKTGKPMSISDTSRTVDNITLDIADNGTTTTVTRQP